MIFFSYYLIGIFLLITAISVIRLTGNINKKNNIYSTNAISFNVINMKGNVELSQLIKKIKVSNDELLSVDLHDINEQQPFVTGLIIGEDYKLGIPLADGGNLSIKDFRKEQFGAVVSENIEQKVYEQDGYKWIDYLGYKYKVVGIIKSNSNKEKVVDMYINLSSMAENKNISQNIMNYTYTYDSGVDTERKIENFKIELSKDMGVDINAYAVMKGSATLMYSLKINTVLITGVVLLIIVMVFTVLNILTYWIESKQLEISIRRVLGASKLESTLWIIKKYLNTTIAGIFFSFISFEILKKLDLFKIFNIKNSNLIYDILGLSAIFIISMIISLIPIIFITKKIYKLSIDLVARGGQR